MKRILVLGAGLLLLMGLSLWTGCSDDDEGTTTPTLTQGDTLDPSFVAFREGVGATDEVTAMMLSMIFNVADSVIHDADNPNAKFMGTPTSLGTEADSIVITYHASSQYWYAYVSSWDTEDTAIIVDSIQFLHSTGPVQWPDSALITGLKSGMSFYWHIGGAIVDASQSITLLGDFPNLGIVTANGTQHATVTFTDSHVELPQDTMGCEYSFGFSTTYSNVTFTLQNFFDVCPSAGSLVHTVSANIECSNDTDTLTVGGGWKVTQTFTGVVSNWVIENATTRWTGIDSCGAAPIAVTALPPLFGEAR